MKKAENDAEVRMENEENREWCCNENGEWSKGDTSTTTKIESELKNDQKYSENEEQKWGV